MQQRNYYSVMKEIDKQRENSIQFITPPNTGWIRKNSGWIKEKNAISVADRLYTE